MLGSIFNKLRRRRDNDQDSDQDGDLDNFMATNFRTNKYQRNKLKNVLHVGSRQLNC